MINREKNIVEQFNDVTNDLIKQLSGRGTDRTVKLMDNVISFIGMAGGCGTSFIVSNLASIMATKYKLQVLIIDLNILYPIQYTYFKGKIARNKPDLVSFLLGRNEVGESIDTKGNISVMYSSNRHLLDYINCDSELGSNNFAGMIDRIKYLFDVIIIDCPMDLGQDVVNMALFKSDSIYTVWDESLSCIANANRFISNLSVTGIDNSKLRAIMNKRTSIQYASSTFESLGYTLLSVIPFDISVMEADLQAQIYSQKGESSSKNAQIIVQRLDQLTEDVLSIGGYSIPSKKKLGGKAMPKKEKVKKEKTKKDKKSKAEQPQQTEDIDSDTTGNLEQMVEIDEATLEFDDSSLTERGEQ